MPHPARSCRQRSPKSPMRIVSFVLLANSALTRPQTRFHQPRYSMVQHRGHLDLPLGRGVPQRPGRSRWATCCHWLCLKRIRPTPPGLPAPPTKGHHHQESRSCPRPIGQRKHEGQTRVVGKGEKMMKNDKDGCCKVFEPVGHHLHPRLYLSYKTNLPRLRFVDQ